MGPGEAQVPTQSSTAQRIETIAKKYLWLTPNNQKQAQGLVFGT